MKGPWGAKSWKTRNISKQPNQKPFESSIPVRVSPKRCWDTTKLDDASKVRTNSSHEVIQSVVHHTYEALTRPTNLLRTLILKTSKELWFRPTYWSCVSVKRSKTRREWGIRVGSEVTEVTEPRKSRDFIWHSFNTRLSNSYFNLFFDPKHIPSDAFRQLILQETRNIDVLSHLRLGGTGRWCLYVEEGSL